MKAVLPRLFYKGGFIKNFVKFTGDIAAGVSFLMVH